MTTLSQRRRMFGARRKIATLGVVLTLLAGVVPPASFVTGPLLLTAGTPGDGAVNVPAHPEGSSFNPNQLKDLQAADPGAKINLIQPPTANNMGDAGVGYPIEVPPGRGDTQPNV